MKFDSQKIIEIDTRIPVVTEPYLSVEDQEFIQKVELKTQNIIKDILDEMKKSLVESQNTSIELKNDHKTTNSGNESIVKGNNGNFSQNPQI